MAAPPTPGQFFLDKGYKRYEKDAFDPNSLNDKQRDQTGESSDDPGAFYSMYKPGAMGGDAAPTPAMSALAATGSTPDAPQQQQGAPGGATVASDVPDTSSALAGLSGAIGMSSGAQEGIPSGQPQEAGGSALRQNLGSRLYPQDNMAVAGLRRAY